MSASSGARILLIEDEAKTARATLQGLKAEGFIPSLASSGEEGFFLANSYPFDAIVLDWMLPGRSGLEVLRTLRARGFKKPVLLLTARDALKDRIAGLDGGADDYLIKPFALTELGARLRALLRRTTANSRAEERQSHWRVADLEVDLALRRVSRAGRQIELTPLEFDLLIYLMVNAGRIVSRETLAREVWQEVRRATNRCLAAVRDYLRLGSLDLVDWRFVEEADVAAGPWSQYEARAAQLVRLLLWLNTPIGGSSDRNRACSRTVYAMGASSRIPPHVDFDLWNLHSLGLGNGRDTMTYAVAYFLALLFLEHNQYSLDRALWTRKRE